MMTDTSIYCADFGNGAGSYGFHLVSRFYNDINSLMWVFIVTTIFYWITVTTTAFSILKTYFRVTVLYLR
jgi:hypothetical protein